MAAGYYYGALDGIDMAVCESDHRIAADDNNNDEDRIILSRCRPRLFRAVAAISLGLFVVSHLLPPRPLLASSSSSVVVVSPSSGSDDDDDDDAGSNAGAGATFEEDTHDENRELFYRDQLVDHFGNDDDDDATSSSSSTWSHRYYKSTEHFGGPGHPIFLVVGGEGGIDRMLYPFVTRVLSPYFGAAVIQIEHRFYGPHRPISGREATASELLELLTPRQAMADMIRLTKVFKEELGCPSPRRVDRSSSSPATADDYDYCPVVTVGGSYPGVLSALFRLAHSDFVDASYAASAPLKTHTQTINQNVYYDIVTKTAEHASKGCANAVRTALTEAKKLIKEASSVEKAAGSMNLCLRKLPEYITDLETLSIDVMMAVGFSFADFNMEAYPPGPDLGLYKACGVFQDEEHTSLEKVGKFFLLVKEEGQEEEAPGDTTDDDVNDDCFDISVFLPDGENARITTSDWSGSGGGNDGEMWDFQLCTTYVDPIGFSPESMFPPREWTYDGLTKYCRSRYGEDVTPRPYALVEDFGFDDLVGNGASRILFTNGMRDMWSGGSYTEDLSDTILALNFENGAHHSDLSHVGPTDSDTDDIKEGYVKIQKILERWLQDVKAEVEAGRKSRLLQQEK